jgi:glycosyltransferase involved in cell wall biosynthesis
MLYHATEHLLPRLCTPTVLTVHDLIFERHPEHHTRRNVWFLKVGMRLFTRAADAIIAVSEHTRRDLINLYAIPADKIYVVYEGVDPCFRPASEAEIARVRTHYRIVRPYLLMVGTLEPRKNHAAALQALARLKAEGHPHMLVIVGGSGWLFEPVHRLVEDLGLQSDVLFTGYVPAADLPALYSGAACVLLPSLYEGFGFPVLEAMACAAPVICSNVSSLPEVTGDAALLVPPTDVDALVAALRLVLSQPALADALRRCGPLQAARFRWDRCAAETVEVYRTLAATSE